MPITNEQVNRMLAYQEEIMLTMSEMKNTITKLEEENKKIKEMFDSSKLPHPGMRG